MKVMHSCVLIPCKQSVVSICLNLGNICNTVMKMNALQGLFMPSKTKSLQLNNTNTNTIYLSWCSLRLDSASIPWRYEYTICRSCKTHTEQVTPKLLYICTHNEHKHIKSISSNTAKHLNIHSLSLNSFKIILRVHKSTSRRCHINVNVHTKANIHITT